MEKKYKIFGILKIISYISFMKQISQTIVSPKNGNCMQAAIASLFECELDDVPNFIEFPSWFPPLREFILKRGYEFEGMLYSDATLKEHMSSKIKDLKGVNGLFYASVWSPKYNPEGIPGNCSHAVIIDKDFNIVWDPNPEYRTEGFKYPNHDNGYNGVHNVHMIEPKENIL